MVSKALQENPFMGECLRMRMSLKGSFYIYLDIIVYFCLF